MPFQAARPVRAPAVRALLAAALLLGVLTPAAHAAGPWSLLDSGTPIANQQSDDPDGVALGVRFSVPPTPGTDYWVGSVRFFHVTPMIGNLVTIYGPNGAQVSHGQAITGGSGLIEVQLPQPVKLTQGLVYTASYYAFGGGYADEQHGFDTPRTVGPVTFYDGVYRYGGGFPSSTWEASGYYVSPVITSSPTPPPPPPPPGPQRWALFDANTPIANPFVDDHDRVEVGVQFRVAQPATGDYWADAVRFQLGLQGSMVETRVFLYDGSGQLISRGEVIGEGGRPGYWEIGLQPRVRLTPGATYTATYLAQYGAYVEEQHGFDTPRTVGPLTFPAEAGVYQYGGGFPSYTWEATNYYVSPVVTAG